MLLIYNEFSASPFGFVRYHETFLFGSYMYFDAHQPVSIMMFIFAVSVDVGSTMLPCSGMHFCPSISIPV